MREKPKEHQIYRHFKGRLYQIVEVAESVEEIVTIVIYRSLFPPYQVWARDLEDFLSEVLPSAEGNLLAQSHRFELIQDMEKMSLSSVPTEVLVEELLKRTDSPVMSSEIMEVDKIFSDEILVADVLEEPTGELDDKSLPIYTSYAVPVLTFEHHELDNAKDWVSRHLSRGRTIFRKVLLRVDF